MNRCVVICPGRGSYSKNTMGCLTGIQSEKLTISNHYRSEVGRPTVTEMDNSEKFRSSLHIAGENASILTAGISAADFDQISNNWDIVGVCGNSMGWYTALGLGGALEFNQTVHLIETMGQYQKKNIIGGQIVYPLVDEDWKMLAERLAHVNEAIRTIPDLHWSIKLGGQAVLGGTNSALEQAIEQLPEIQQNKIVFPLRLPLHSAFHTPLMTNTHRQAIRDLFELPMRTPKIPLIDGQGKIWRPKACNSEELLEYTLGIQVVEQYDFTKMIKSVLTHFAPDKLILLGPGSNLGSATAQVLIQEEWRGIKSKKEFLAIQKEDPFILSMGREDQRTMTTK